MTIGKPGAFIMGNRLVESEAKFSQTRNDMFWKFYDSNDGFIRWAGYDDSYWWDSVSPTDNARNRIGKVTGRTYRLDHETNEVEILP